ncbi:MAG: MarR family transcriptional regulator [Actinomycetota bacterium]|nr:MarR family transcriptional regulator [Actinomycetota bacterium]MDA8208318.1 MarR family transcriptional regulator [Actinomycetota bacterium]
MSVDEANSGREWLDELEELAWRRLLRANALLLGRLDSELVAEHSMTLAEYEVLVHLSEAEGNQLRMSALAELALVSRSGLTRRVESMAARGLVSKEICPSDRRGMIAHLTELGRKRLEEAVPTHIAGVRRYLLDGLSRKDVSELARLLEVPLSRLERP